MKMVNKILLGLAAGAVVLSLVGCGDLAGAGKGKGTKNNLTITVDATDNANKKLDKAYRRFIKQIGTSEKIAEIETTITFNTNDCILKAGTTASPTYANVGFVFDMNKTWDNTTNKATTDTSESKLRDLVVFGFQPLNKRAYVEHYTGVNFKDELDTDDGSLPGKDANIFGNGSWASVTENTDYTLEDGVYTLKVKVKQTTKGTYEFYLGNKNLGSYKSSGKYVGKAADNIEGYAIGAVAGYVNCPKGTKVVANYVTDSKSITGKFEAEEFED